MKTKITVLDTNVYGWYLAYTDKGSEEPEARNVFNFLSKIFENKSLVNVLATQTVEKEIKDAKDSELSKLFYSTANGVIKTTRRVKDLATEYFDACRKIELRLVTIEDCEITAAATVAGAKLLVTENRRTLNNPLVIKTIETVNRSKNLKTVKIVDSKNAIGDIFV